MSKYGHRTINWFEAIVNKLGGEEAAEKFLRGELTISESVRSWREQDGVIYFTLPPTDGTTGPQWIERLEKKGFRLSKWAKDVLSSPDFKPTNGIISDIAVLKGMLWNDSDRVTKNIRKDAYAGTFTKGKALSDPNAEVACLIREMFSDEELEAMGLWWIVAMHEPINASDGDPDLLHADRSGGGQWLNTRAMSSLTASGVATMALRSSPRKLVLRTLFLRPSPQKLRPKSFEPCVVFQHRVFILC